MDADVNYQVAKDFTNKVKEHVQDDKVLQAVNPGQQFVKAIYDELVYLLGDVHVDLNKAKKPPTVILVAGLQGAGKTTFVGKLALFLKSKGRSPMVAAADVYRPAAVDQLETLAGQVGVPVFSIRGDDGVPAERRRRRGRPRPSPRPGGPGATRSSSTRPAGSTSTSR